MERLLNSKGLMWVKETELLLFIYYKSKTRIKLMVRSRSSQYFRVLFQTGERSSWYWCLLLSDHSCSRSSRLSVRADHRARPWTTNVNNAFCFITGVMTGQSDSSSCHRDYHWVTLLKRRCVNVDTQGPTVSEMVSLSHREEKAPCC